MGILDDAIREHLDLKRRRGADPTEIERLEREALGPVRRVPNDTAEALLDDEDVLPETYPVEDDRAWDDSPGVPEWAARPEEDPPYGHRPDPDLEGPPTEHWPAPGSAEEFEDLPETGYGDGPPTSEETRVDLPRHHEIAEEWEAHERRSIGEPAGIEPDSPAPAPPPPPPAPADPVFEAGRQRAMPSQFDEETAEFEIEVDEEEVRPPSADQPEGEDVLEETPDFLQDTPDHDRLWFEQRPPRDFDFDG